MRVFPGNARQIGDRHQQQDEFAFTNIEDATFVAHGGVAAVVADGMGGMAMGREASQCAVRAILAAYEKKSFDETIPEALARAFFHANGEILQLAEAAGIHGQVGTALVAAVIHQGQLYWASVGDSRLYLYRQGRLSQISTDHTYAVELARAVECGDLSQEEAERHPERHSLTSYLGLESLTEIDISATPQVLHVGDRVLLCSDGLHGTLAATEMAAVLVGDPQQAAEALVRETLRKQKPHQDNVTAVVMAWEDEHWQQQSSRTLGMDTLRLYRYAILVLAFLFVGTMGLFIIRYSKILRDHDQGNTQKDNSTSMLESSPPSEQSSAPESRGSKGDQEQSALPLINHRQGEAMTPRIGKENEVHQRGEEE